MRTLPFKSSSIASIGVELEIQLINPITFDLNSNAKTLIRNIRESDFHSHIKPEITQSMLEINSSVHLSIETLYEEFLIIQAFLLKQAKYLNFYFSGGGTHPFQKWVLRKIFPNKRFKNLSRIYRYLSKCSTVFGQHIHIGCPNAENALYLTHAIARYIPQLIAISASSPFYQGIDTGYHSSRLTVFNAYPSSGVIPYLLSWQEFSAYYFKMQKFDIIQSMKDFYWDIRPKPELGTVEIRICDTPLTIRKVILITAYVQALSLYLLQEHPLKPTLDLYHLYNFNRFQACRYGFNGNFIDPFTHERRTILEDFDLTSKLIQKYAIQLNIRNWISELNDATFRKENDANYLRKILKEVHTLPKMVNHQCQLWEKK